MMILRKKQPNILIWYRLEDHPNRVVFFFGHTSHAKLDTDETGSGAKSTSKIL